MSQTLKKFILLVTPSWAGGITIAVVAALILAANFYKTHATVSALAEGMQSFQALFGPLYHRLTDSLAQNNIVSNLPLLLFWALIGAAVYVIAVHLVTAVSDTALLEQTMFYSNVERGGYLRSLAISSALRLVALFGWFIYCSVFFKIILPSATATARSVAQTNVLSSGSGLLGAALILTAALHLHVVFVRLIMLRLRIFSDSVID